MECFSTYSRMQAGMKDKPDVEEIIGLTPALAVDQRPFSKSSRSTLAQ